MTDDALAVAGDRIATSSQISLTREHQRFVTVRDVAASFQRG
jgi:hypothetical protein